MLMSMERTDHEMPKNIAVFSNINRLLKCLTSKLPNVRFQEVIPGSKEEQTDLQKAEILIADYNLIVPYMYKLPNLKWIQGTWAGAEVILNGIDSKKPRLPYTITRFSGDYFGSMMGEYVITAIVTHERNWDVMVDNRREGVWLKESQFQLNINDHRGVYDLKIGILGMGAIGKEIANVLKTLKGTIWAMARTIPAEKPAFIDRFVRQEDLPELLKECDYIINVLPSTSDTIGLLNGEMLKHCAGKKTVFINIGRGTVIKESDLVAALEKKWLAAAVLDVFEVEPLPTSSPLWKMPQVMITPHMSGVTKAEYVAELFSDNYDRFKSGQELKHILNVDRGY